MEVTSFLKSHAYSSHKEPDDFVSAIVFCGFYRSEVVE